jgi:hypothetical protein
VCLITLIPGSLRLIGVISGLMYLIWKFSSAGGTSMGTPVAWLGCSLRDGDADMAAPEFDLACSGTIVP